MANTHSNPIEAIEVNDKILDFIESELGHELPEDQFLTFTATETNNISAKLNSKVIEFAKNELGCEIKPCDTITVCTTPGSTVNWEYGERPNTIECTIFRPNGRYYTCEDIKIPNELTSIIDNATRWGAIREFIENYFNEYESYRTMTIVINNTKRQDLIGWPMMILPRETE